MKCFFSRVCLRVRKEDLMAYSQILTVLTISCSLVSYLEELHSKSNQMFDLLRKKMLFFSTENGIF